MCKEYRVADARHPPRVSSDTQKYRHVAILECQGKTLCSCTADFYVSGNYWEKFVDAPRLPCLKFEWYIGREKYLEGSASLSEYRRYSIWHFGYRRKQGREREEGNSSRLPNVMDLLWHVQSHLFCTHYWDAPQKDKARQNFKISFTQMTWHRWKFRHRWDSHARLTISRLSNVFPEKELIPFRGIPHCCKMMGPQRRRWRSCLDEVIAVLRDTTFDGLSTEACDFENFVGHAASEFFGDVFMDGIPMFLSIIHSRGMGQD